MMPVKKLLLPLFALITLCLQAAENPADPLADPTNSLRILSYNIKMLPRMLAHLKHHPIKRAKLIPQSILEDTVDIVVFQEAFDRKAIRILKKKLEQTYPYTVGPANSKRPSFKVSSGVWMISKFPIHELGTVDFKECEKEDCMARKGALLVEGTWNGKKIQVMGTHAEAGGSMDLKKGQFYEMQELVNKHKTESVPQFFCGDFNTRKGTALYDTLLAVFAAEDGPISSELQFTSDHLLNDMSHYNPKSRNVIDYVLYRGNGIQPKAIKREVRRYECAWDKTHCDLSDHMAILMKIAF